MIRSRMDILRRLLALSRIHLQLVFAEKWEDWEAIAHEKEDLYNRLMAFGGALVLPEEKEIVDIIREVEEQASGELTLKRNETKKELAEVERFAGGIRTYRDSYQKGSKRHFSLKV